MLKGTTKSGFRYEINENIGDDYELLKLITKVEQDGTLIFDLTEKLLGVKQAANLEKFLKKRDSYVSTKKVIEEVIEIFNSQAMLKN
ncbi:hypothetical protein [Lactococcus formosensis]|uniref:hypothetical protein n=1 Tax=Lactococcus formosensis TaxID=1281486 RepID=UPI00243613C0|nr:hypothetical protein [Lactococcus formosensis]MDG6113747.1 hypothetical protein [Lactococcus formosensis]MDG6122262.1 hypothetical protein [Lactococcus formosensis]MDG6151868.1 hypothetical protein [Lactococcus formosensis]MDG6174912.1 hypothetical protein [Lactococcus formosensis]MDG6181230.1 hypothetical protein [Lactococcus formosensis]